MAGWNGAGVFTPTYYFVNDVGVVNILASKQDTQWNTYAVGLMNCLTRDGQTTPTANTGWNSKKITSLGTPTAATDAATKGYTDVPSGASRVVRGGGTNTNFVSGTPLNLFTGGGTAVIDNLVEFNTSTGLFTAAAAGSYTITVVVDLFESVAVTYTASPQLSIMVNGSAALTGFFGAWQSASSQRLLPSLTLLYGVVLAVGGTLGAQALVTFSAGTIRPFNQWLSIQRWL